MTRYPGSNWFTSAWNGRGVLIVIGAFGASSSFTWDGIILAGAIATSPHVHGQIRGMLIGGLNGQNPGGDLVWGADNRYYSCNVYKANESLSYLELVENTVFEAN